MTYAEENLARVRALPDDDPVKKDLIRHWTFERKHEIAIEREYKERKEYEAMGLEYPF